MKIIKASHQIINEPNITKKIERIARICYKSEDKIGEGTDIKMIKTLIKNQHTAMLEHGSVVLEVSEQEYDFISDNISVIESSIISVEKNKRMYLRCSYTISSTKGIRYIISGNLRAWFDYMTEVVKFNALSKELVTALNSVTNNIFEEFEDAYVDTKEYEFYNPSDAVYRVITDMNELSSQERMIHEDISILFTVDRGVTHELVRHRDCSFAQESTRYCNYNLGKFGNEITVIEPCFWDTTPENSTPESIACYNAWHDSCVFAETQYFNIIENKGTPQQARDVLPTSVKAEIVMTTNLREWKHILNLRACDATGPAHPQMKEVMVPLLKEIRPKYEFAFGDLYASDEVHP